MKKAEIIAMVEGFLEPFAREKQYEIVDVDFVKEGANWYLRVFADKEGGFSINDCVDTSHYLDAKLEKADPIEIPYVHHALPVAAVQIHSVQDPRLSHKIQHPVIDLQAAVVYIRVTGCCIMCTVRSGA